jgi:hypothetical protein
VFTPVLEKHSKSFSLIDSISVGVDRMQRNFEPMRKQVETWQRSELTDVTPKVVIYEASGKLRWRPGVLAGLALSRSLGWNRRSSFLQRRSHWRTMHFSLQLQQV